MDGTLLDEQGNLPEEFPQVVEEMKAHGVLFAPSSGRQYYSLMDSFPAYKNDFLFVAENGTMVMYQGKEISSSPMPRKLALKVLRTALENTSGYAVACGKKSAYALERQYTDEFKVEMHKYFTHAKAVANFDDVDDEIAKLSVNTNLVEGQNVNTYQVITTYPDNTLNTQNATKMYKATGSNEDGTMTQKAITDALDTKVSNTTLNIYAT